MDVKTTFSGQNAHRRQKCDILPVPEIPEEREKMGKCYEKKIINSGNDCNNGNVPGNNTGICGQYKI